MWSFQSLGVRRGHVDPSASHTGSVSSVSRRSRASCSVCSAHSSSTRAESASSSAISSAVNDWQNALRHALMRLKLAGSYRIAALLR